MAGSGVDAMDVQVLDVTFRPAPTVPGQVRMLVELRLIEWGLAQLVDDVTLIASELVTNAVQHTFGPQIRVRFTREPHGVLLGVWDGSDVLPLRGRVAETASNATGPLEAGLEDETSGRGLPIVAALATRFGVSRTQPHGKWTWARVSE
ncbi:histidine kinase-like protein [Actinomadura pelletieri DSM 43383]|uniref:Histidine kinase-like protein n=1 Tax=Actinomadura pelletieri DSM 43383 TaxID=1120940 RepID=A0A495QZ87_9ACTN|nr:ATP-binding protein [Actinomadura pelletieri]RKS79377.1 histidine kinase-like protein [Actinomadura pelletieri DSM 43383]